MLSWWRLRQLVRRLPYLLLRLPLRLLLRLQLLVQWERRQTLSSKRWRAKIWRCTRTWLHLL